MEGYDDKFVSPNAGWSRIASYYRPCWALIPMIFVSIVNAFKMVPIAGFMLYLFYFCTEFPIYVDEDRVSEWEMRVFVGLLLYFVFCLFFGVITAVERT